MILKIINKQRIGGEVNLIKRIYKNKHLKQNKMKQDLSSDNILNGER